MPRILTTTLVLCALTLLACTGKDDAPDATMTPPPGAPTATSTTTPPPAATPVLSVAELPQLEWQKLPGPPATTEAYEPYILDLQTGDFYTFLKNRSDAFPHEGPDGKYRSISLQGWSDIHGFVVTVGMFKMAPREHLEATYAARIGEPFKLLIPPSREDWWGDIEMENGAVYGRQHQDLTGKIRTLIFDPQTFAVRQVIDGRMPVGASADGRYLALMDDSSRTFEVAELQSSRFVTVAKDLLGTSPVWSNTGHQLAYQKFTDDNQLGAFSIFDPATEGTRDITEASYGATWSPDDRYIVSRSVTDDPANPPGFVVYEVATGKALTRVTGSWPGQWQDADTMVFTGNVCSTFDAFSMNADGSDLRQLTVGGPHPWVFELTPDRSEVVYSPSFEPPSILRFLNLQNGATRDIQIGGLSIFGGLVWHHDGRYLELRQAIGKDGPCYGPTNVPHQTEVQRLP